MGRIWGSAAGPVTTPANKLVGCPGCMAGLTGVCATQGILYRSSYSTH